MAEQAGDSRQGGLDYDDTQFFFPASILSRKIPGSLRNDIRGAAGGRVHGRNGVDE